MSKKERIIVIEKEKLNKLGEYIKKIREMKNLGTNQLAKKIGFNASNITKLEKGEMATAHPIILQKIAKALKIDYKDLYSILGYLTSEDYEDFNSIINSSEAITIPIYGIVSAGVGYLNFENEGKSLTIINNFDLDKNSFAMRVDGNSMEPEIIEDSYVLIDPTQCDYRELNNKIVVSRYDGEVYVKRVMTYDDLVILRSINPEYEDIIIQGDDFENLECVGKVVKVLYEKDYH